MKQSDIDRSAYALAMEYLLGFQEKGLTETLLEEYLNPSLDSLRSSDISSIYYRLLDSAQNRGMSSGVIGGAIGHWSLSQIQLKVGWRLKVDRD
jgi:hypothetical protein